MKRAPKPTFDVNEAQALLQTIDGTLNLVSDRLNNENCPEAHGVNAARLLLDKLDSMLEK